MSAFSVLPCLALIFIVLCTDEVRTGEYIEDDDDYDVDAENDGDEMC